MGFFVFAPLLFISISEPSNFGPSSPGAYVKKLVPSPTFRRSDLFEEVTTEGEPNEEKYTPF